MAVTRVALRWALATGAWALVGACGGDDKDDKGGSASGTDAALEANAKSKLVGCKLYDAKSSASDTAIEDDYDRCAARCLIAASCDDLSELFCSDSLGGFSNPFLVCIAKCSDTPADGYACSDGARIPHVALCDGTDDCGDEADEKGCGTHTCKDGEKLDVSDVLCDQFEDCEDGSDEQGCAEICPAAS